VWVTACTNSSAFHLIKRACWLGCDTEKEALIKHRIFKRVWPASSKDNWGNTHPLWLHCCIFLSTFFEMIRRTDGEGDFKSKCGPSASCPGDTPTSPLFCSSQLHTHNIRKWMRNKRNQQASNKEIILINHFLLVARGSHRP